MIHARPQSGEVRVWPPGCSQINNFRKLIIWEALWQSVPKCENSENVLFRFQNEFESPLAPGSWQPRHLEGQLAVSIDTQACIGA